MRPPSTPGKIKKRETLEEPHYIAKESLVDLHHVLIPGAEAPKDARRKAEKE
jgi:hypothetical protein